MIYVFTVVRVDTKISLYFATLVSFDISYLGLETGQIRSGFDRPEFGLQIFLKHISHLNFYNFYNIKKKLIK
jgi:hypothetical protein